MSDTVFELFPDMLYSFYSLPNVILPFIAGIVMVCLSASFKAVASYTTSIT